MNNTVIISAAGSGTRMKCDKNKLLLDIAGKAVIERTVEAFINANVAENIILVVRKDEEEQFRKLLKKYKITFCNGGATRQESVFNAVKSISCGCDLLIIHDGARPLITQKSIIEVVNKAKETGAAAVGVPVKDTIKVINAENIIVDTPKRSSLIAIQTPQIFDYEKYKNAMYLAQRQGKDFTDDCRLLENAGESVSVVIGEYSNIKITTPEDIPTAASILKARGEQ